MARRPGRAQNYTLMAQSPHNTMTWGLNRVALPVDNIAPGQSTTFTFQVTAPANAGAYTFQWGMQRETYGSFGPGTTPVTINVVAPPPLVNNAQVVGMTAPSRMIAGQRYDVAVTMRNTGTTTWAPGSNQLLGSQNPQDNAVWGMGRVQLPVAVAPGQQYTFTFQVTAPAPGDYNIQWRMLQEGVEWFGATAGSAVTVTENLGNVTFIHTDGLGSPVARTDATGNVVSRTRYEPYGYTASGATPSIGFTGHAHDADTGLTYMQQRYYDPVAGRFLSIDPVNTDANAGKGFNRYSYAINNPYAYIDPEGREEQRREPDKRDQQIEDALKRQRDRCQVDCYTINYQGGTRTDVRGGFNTRGESLVYHPDVYNPDAAAQILIFGAASLLPELFWGKAIAPVADFFAGTRYTSKVLGQMKNSDFHAFPESVRAFQSNGVRSTIKGGDGITREMLRIPGGYRGKTGYFEFIKEADGTINHRLFKALMEAK